MGTRLFANPAGFITDSKEIFFHQSKTSDGLKVNHVGIIVEYPHPRPNKGVYHAVYLSVPAGVYVSLEDDDLTQHDVTFSCVRGPVQEIPVTYEALAAITETDMWLGWDDMNQLLGADGLRKRAIMAINLIVFGANI